MTPAVMDQIIYGAGDSIAASNIDFADSDIIVGVNAEGTGY